MNISPQDKALIITFSSASLLILAFFFLHMKPYEDEIAEEFFEIPMVEELPEPEEKEELSPEEQAKISHQAFNQERRLAEARQFLEKPDEIREAIENNKLGSVKDLMEEYEQDGAEDRNDLAMAKAKPTPPLSSGNELKKAVAKPQANTRRTTISYILKERNAIKIPNPVYTCEATGKVVINITVKSNGVVSKAAFNSAASTTSNGCLVDQALEYAERAYFDESQRASQLGSITFLFQG
ncbi:hypothetical protein [Croceiramulus getboli]|nr:hypothetical protein P8624_06290 [Flavobacteriaceae bacterium YJPT1-3]